jgi:multicomponent Na+:H+ antiporter subunit E
MRSTAAVFAVCFAFWWLLSDRYSWLALVLGVVACSLVAWANREIEIVSRLLPVAPRVLAYAPWLLKEIVVANLNVARVILDPRRPIDPVVIRVDTPLTSELALMTLGNSVTLTPGTVTLDVDGQALVVHALTRETAAALQEGAMTRRVAAIYDEPRP